MKLKSITAFGLLVVTAFFFASCSKDDVSSKLQFVADGEAYSLKGANLYLIKEGDFYNRTYRNYFITDGTYTNGDFQEGWSLGSYTGATYLIVVQLASVVGGDLVTGDFPQHSDWGAADYELPISSIDTESGAGNDLLVNYTSDYNEDFSPVTVSGGFEDGEKMTIKFNGVLTRNYYDGANWTLKAVSGKFYFNGTVNDER